MPLPKPQAEKSLARRWLTERKPPAPRPEDYSSRLHSQAVAARMGALLGGAFLICFLTGLISHFLQHPLPFLNWPNRPIWLYRVTQGLHVTTGFASIPLLALKLWTVSPNFWQWPPVTSVLNGIERLSIFVLVGSVFFQLITGLFNVAEFYPWKFFFTSAHYATAWIAIGSILIHIAVKLPIIRRAFGADIEADVEVPRDVLAEQLLAEVRQQVANREARTGPRPARVSRRARTQLSSARTAPPAGAPAGPDRPWPTRRTHVGPLTRRGMFALAGGSVALTVLATVGDKIPALRWVSVLAQRDGSGPNGLPVNRTAQEAGVSESAADPAWTLTVQGPVTRSLSLADLKALPQRTVDLPISCVEGWSQSATWTGVRLADLLGLVGSPGSGALVRSLESGIYDTSEVSPQHAADDDMLVALELNGQILDIDHGYPARLIGPSRPGVLQTKWLTRIEAQ